jgi:tRNA dimethylallyltransferase
LLRPRPILIARIDKRIDAMLAAGWIDEVRALQAKSGTLTAGVAQMVGYREIADHLAGRISFDEMRSAIQIRTRQFAKRQMTWFRHLQELTFFEFEESGDSEEEEHNAMVERLMAFLAAA